MKTDKSCYTISGFHCDVVSTMLDMIEALIVVVDLAGQIVFFNKKCEQLTGYTLSEVRGKNFRDFLGADRDTAGHYFTEECGSQFPCECESHWVTKSGQVHYIAWTSHGLPDKDGNIELIISTGKDISACKRTQTALGESEE